jgi:hypothetical protein
MWPRPWMGSSIIDSDPHRYLYWRFSIWPEMAFGLSQNHSNSEPWILSGIPRFRTSTTMYLLYICQWKRYQYYRLLQTIDILWDVPFSIENYYERLSFFLNIFALADTRGDVGWSWPEVGQEWLRSGWGRPEVGLKLALSGWRAEISRSTPREVASQRTSKGEITAGPQKMDVRPTSERDTQLLSREITFTRGFI